MLSASQNEKDKQKWANRAVAANAERLLRDFNENLNKKLRHKKDSRPGGWKLSITETAKNQYNFFGISGNEEIWTANLLMTKYNSSSEDEGPGGLYNGMGTFQVEYKISTFDNGLKDRFVEMFITENDQTLNSSGIIVGSYMDDPTQQASNEHSQSRIAQQ